eukprot:snap_masked-scaffold_12-processed-gene-2.18-mRNA-1 protein AED:1.00 eAED:1.00 QI:0/0/0/0/1/1/2/0/69
MQLLATPANFLKVGTALTWSPREMKTKSLDLFTTQIKSMSMVKFSDDEETILPFFILNVPPKFVFANPF